MEPLSVLYAPFSGVTILVNLFLIVTILSCKKLRKKRYNVFMLSLAFADLLVGVAFSLNVFKDTSSEMDTDIVACRVLKGIVVLAVSASIYNFVWIALERWMMLNHTEFYQTHKISKLTVILIIWIAGICQAVPIWINVNDINNVSVKRCTYRHMKTGWWMGASITILIVPTLILILLHTLITRHMYRSPHLVIGETMRTFIALSLICLTFLLCWWPFVIYMGVTWSTTPLGNGDTIAINWALTNSLIDPLIFISFNEPVKETIKAIMCGRCCPSWLRNAHYIDTGEDSTEV